jgi:hypothetical protein
MAGRFAIIKAYTLIITLPDDHNTWDRFYFYIYPKHVYNKIADQDRASQDNQDPEQCFNHFQPPNALYAYLGTLGYVGGIQACSAPAPSP